MKNHNQDVDVMMTMIPVDLLVSNDEYSYSEWVNQIQSMVLYSLFHLIYSFHFIFNVLFCFLTFLFNQIQLIDWFNVMENL